ncbi:MAG: helix-turn-helix transcriptional regulator [Desulfovibrionales bacterium]|nr:helix-turn-helix transcriptional regulator [Desulfovibrionales bacterium]
MKHKKKAIDALRSLGFAEVFFSGEAIPWRAAFPEYTDEQLPGRILAGARVKEGMSQVRLAKLTGIPQRHISEMENGKRPIGKKNAKLFAEALKVDYRIFL